MIVSWCTAAGVLALVADDGGASSAEVWRTISRIFNGVIGALPIIFGLGVPIIGILAARQKAKAAAAASATAGSGAGVKRSQLSVFLSDLLEKHAQAQQQQQQLSGRAASRARAEAARRAREESEEEDRYWHQDETEVVPVRPASMPVMPKPQTAPPPKAGRRSVLRRAIVLQTVFGQPKSLTSRRP